MITLKTNEWSIENVDTVLFDKDGTLIDLHYFWGKMTELRVNKIIEFYSLSPTIQEKLCSFLGYNIKTKKMQSDGITALYSRSTIIEIFNKNLISLGINSTENEIENLFNTVSKNFYKKIDLYTKPLCEAIDFVKKIKKQGLKTGIVTADSVESTNITLKNFGWENLFDVVIGRESSPYTKESGLPTKMALNFLNSDPKNTIMIGDSPTDVLSASKAGVTKTILVATGQVDINELKNNSKYVLNTLEELNIENKKFLR